MQCQFCNHSFNISTHLPVLTHNGETQCHKCYLKSTNSSHLQQTYVDIISFKKVEQPKVNKELVKLMGRCPVHIEQKLTLFDVESRKRRCPKCIIFSKDKQKYENRTFVEIDDQHHKLNDVLIENIKLLVEDITKIESSLLKKISADKQDAAKKMSQTLEKQYKKYQNDLEKAYQQQKQRVIKTIEETWFSKTLVDKIAQFEQIRKKFTEMGSFEKYNSQQKYCKIAEAIEMKQKIKQIEKSMSSDVSCISKKLIKVASEFECSFRCDIIKVDLYKILNNKKIMEEAAEQQSLIDMECNQEQKVAFMDFALDLSRSTIKSVPSQASTQRTSMTCTSQSITVSMDSKPKSTLVVSSLNELNKIQTQIKEVSLSCTEINNTDAKKVLGLVAKSFARTLDLSGNKITSLFVKQLNKSNIGKYLKTIKLTKNQIDVKDTAILKKIEQLKSQGVSILI